MNSITFTLPWLPILIGLGGISVIVAFYHTMRKAVLAGKARKADKDVADKARRADKDVAEASRRKEIQTMFPAPWNAAYEKILQIHMTERNNPYSRAFLKHWLSEQENLPRLSRAAVLELARNITFEFCDKWDMCLAILDPYTDENRSLEKADQDAQKQKKKEAKDEEFAQNKAMFPYPWDRAYDMCKNAKTWKGAQLWLRKWLKEQTFLSSISVEAAEELMTKVADVQNGEDQIYCTIFALLAPHLDTGYVQIGVSRSSHDISDYNLENKLPGMWFKFWKEIKDFPDRRSLFLNKLSRYVDLPHPVFNEPLTVEQATLLSRALGGGESSETRFYASDLARCVVMTAERGGKMDYYRSRTGYNAPCLGGEKEGPQAGKEVPQAGKEVPF